MYMFSVHIFFRASGATEAAAYSGPPPHPADLPWEAQPTPLPAQVGHNIPSKYVNIYIHMYVFYYRFLFIKATWGIASAAL